ncbi:MAG: O-antigen ligase family protein [Patescibacteria group bacterium]
MSFSKKLDRAAFAISIALIALLPFHAFLFTWLKSFFWTDAWTILIQAWKEILVGILGVLALVKLVSSRKFPRSRTFWLGLIFVISAILYATFGSGIWTQKLLGLRTATLFLLAFLAVQFFDFDELNIERLKKIFLSAGGLVILFALAQKFLLPSDFLKYFGYSENVSSWQPGGNLPIYHLVGESGQIRSQATFAGPNQLGAFLLLLLPVALTEFWAKRKTKNFWPYFLGIEILGGILVLVWTFSRSAWLGAAVIFLLFAGKMWRRNLPAKIKKRLAFGAFAAISGIMILLFSNQNLGAIIGRAASTGEHFTKSIQAAALVWAHPLGLGLGQTGGISQRFNHALTPENTFLGIALELGWLGGILFLVFLLSLALDLKKAGSEIFYALIGITVIMFFLHPLEDAPTALSLFLLAGMVNSPK